MTRPFEPEDGHPGVCTAADGRATAEAAASSTSCPRCRALEDRIAALEAEVAALRSRGRKLARGPAARDFAARPVGVAAIGFQGAPAPPATAGERAGGCGRRPRDGTGWTSMNTPISASPWSSPTSGAGRSSARPTSASPGTGRPTSAGLRVEVDPQYAPAIKSQFGSGIVTFSPPWLFRTPPGWDLYLKGPSNRWKTELRSRSKA